MLAFPFRDSTLSYYYFLKGIYVNITASFLHESTPMGNGIRDMCCQEQRINYYIFHAYKVENVYN